VQAPSAVKNPEARGPPTIPRACKAVNQPFDHLITA
jgi:hypothetical protein